MFRCAKLISCETSEGPQPWIHRPIHIRAAHNSRRLERDASSIEHFETTTGKCMELIVCIDRYTQIKLYVMELIETQCDRIDIFINDTKNDRLP